MAFTLATAPSHALPVSFSIRSSTLCCTRSTASSCSSLSSAAGFCSSRTCTSPTAGRRHSLKRGSPSYPGSCSSVSLPHLVCVLQIRFHPRLRGAPGDPVAVQPGGRPPVAPAALLVHADLQTSATPVHLGTFQLTELYRWSSAEIKPHKQPDPSALLALFNLAPYGRVFTPRLTASNWLYCNGQSYGGIFRKAPSVAALGGYCGSGVKCSSRRSRLCH